MEQTYGTAENLNFNKIWALFQETDKKFQETDMRFQETDKKYQEIAQNFRETEKFIQNTTKEIKNLSKKMSESESRWGKFVEALVEGKIIELLRQRNIDVTETYTRVKSDKREMEIDIIAANGKDSVVVEVKTTLNIDKVDDFLDKLKNFKSVFHRFDDSVIYGAVGYIQDESSAAKYAQKKGLYVIKAIGEGARIINKKDFQPRTW
ncbi:MAG: hypothetical protein QG635_991 [Bacteroidota bacterium]|nr:hypothetical protein [Bacteroidota bacterium]